MVFTERTKYQCSAVQGSTVQCSTVQCGAVKHFGIWKACTGYSRNGLFPINCTLYSVRCTLRSTHYSASAAPVCWVHQSNVDAFIHCCLPSPVTQTLYTPTEQWTLYAVHHMLFIKQCKRYDVYCKYCILYKLLFQPCTTPWTLNNTHLDIPCYDVLEKAC